jgi:hypothetical protein
MGPHGCLTSFRDEHEVKPLHEVLKQCPISCEFNWLVLSWVFMAPSFAVTIQCWPKVDCWPPFDSALEYVLLIQESVGFFAHLKDLGFFTASQFRIQ